MSLRRPSPSLRPWRASRRVRGAIVIAAAAVAVLLGGWLWLRDSSLVAVRRVVVTGESGPDAAAIRAALVDAARGMTTLDVRLDRLRDAVSRYPAVKALHVSTQFPHGMRIRVVEQLPVAAILVAGRRIAVAQDGTLLRDVGAASLPLLPLGVPPGGPRLTERPALAALATLAAAPYQLLARIAQATTTPAHGVVAQLRGGPAIYFGAAADLRAKWLAAVAVLADPVSAGASYIDVTDPARPAAGAS